MNVHAANKRSACDRCRDQKLRCPRNDKGSGTCARCLRAGAICVTSSSRPPGRPRAVGSPLATAQTTWRGQHHLDTTSGTPAPLLRNMDATVDNASWSNLNMGISAPTDAMQDSLSLNPSDVDPWAQLDVSSVFGLQMNGDSLLEFLENRQSPSIGEAVRADQLASLEIPMQTETSVGGIPEMPLFTTMATEERHEVDESVVAGLSATSALIDLSRLNEGMARQLSELNSYPWRSPQMEKYCSEKTQTIAGNPIAQALQSTARFIMILRGLVTSISPPHNDSHPTTPIPTPSSDSGISVASVPGQTNSVEHGISTKDDTGVAILSTPVILLILSTHLQQLQLWSSMLGRAYELLRTLPEEAFESFRAPSEFHVVGLPGMKGRLYGKILIHIVQDQLSTVERLLALPSEYRLGECTSIFHSEGIFSNPAFSDILHVAMTQSDNIRETTGMRLVVSLEETLKRVLEVLNN